MPAHPHAELMRLYYEDALTTDKPELLWEFSLNGIDWLSCTHGAPWEIHVKYRRKQKYILINGYEVPEPLRKAPLNGTNFYLALPTAHNMILYTWEGISFDKFHLKNGFVHLTKEAAELHARALLSFTAIPDALEDS